jgi:hypothetical protein
VRTGEQGGLEIDPPAPIHLSGNYDYVIAVQHYRNFEVSRLAGKCAFLKLWKAVLFNNVIGTP